MLHSRIDASKAILGDLRGWITAGSGDYSMQEVRDLYAKAQTIYTCANIRARNVSAVPMRAVDHTGKPIEHAVNAVFKSWWNFTNTLYRSELTMFFQGSNLVLPQTNFMGHFQPAGENLRWFNPRAWSKDVDTTHGLRGFHITGVGFVEASDALYMHGFDFNDDFEGIAPAEVAFYAAGGQSELWQTIYSFMMNRAIPAAIIQPAADKGASTLSQKDAPKRLQDLLTRLFQGSRNAGKALVSPDRLEAIMMQLDIEKAGVSTISPEQRKAIAEASEVPLLLVDFSEATFANGDAAVQFWFRHWLKPRCEWYAGNFSQFFSHWYQETITIAPDFTGIIIEDDDTDRINAQLSAGYRTVYSAQVDTGLDADERLKDIYMINGVPTHIDAIVSAAKPKPAMPIQPLLSTPPPLTLLPARTVRSRKNQGEGYVAIPLPNDTGLVGLQKQLRELGVEGEYQAPDTFHVTLVYCENISDHDFVSEIADRISSVQPIEIKGSKLGLFENGDERALHIEIEKTPELLALQRSFYQDFKDAGFEKELSAFSDPDKYTPHITLVYLTPDSKADLSIDVDFKSQVKSVDFTRENYKVVASIPAKRAHIPDAIYNEIQIAARKGADFIAVELPAHTETYIKALHRFGVDKPEIIKAAKAFYLGVVGTKALSATRNAFTEEFSSLLERALSDEASSRQFSGKLRSLINQYMDRLFEDGITDGGGDVAEIDADDRNILANLKGQQSGYVSDLLTAIYKEDKVTIDQAALKPDMWFNKSLMPAYNAGLESAARNMLMEFSGDDGLESCPDCQVLKGQIHSYKAWKNRELVPPTDKTACKGYQCNHRLVPAPGKRAQGNWLVAAKSHEHNHGDNGELAQVAV